MRKFITFLFLTGLSLFFFSCKNFFGGGDFLIELEKAVDYVQAGYANVTINAKTSETDYILPAVGTYDKTYKAGDSIQLGFIPTAKFQFVKWTATGDVNFINPYIPSTNATVSNIQNPITIEPKIVTKPTASFSPGNSVENPRNTAIVITFSEPMDDLEETISNIAITKSDGMSEEDALSYYPDPKISDDRKSITFKPDRNNLINIKEGTTNSIKVSFKKDSLYYTVKDGNESIKITLDQDYEYSFKINSTTEDKASIKVNASTSECDLSYMGTKTYYLDESFSVSCTPKTGYRIENWEAVYTDDEGAEKSVESSVLLLETSDDKKSVTATLLTGFQKEITLRPILLSKEKLYVSFDAKPASMIPAESKIFYEGDTFTISYREIADYQFTGWKVEDLQGNDASAYITFYNEDETDTSNPAKKMETYCKVIKTDASVVVKAESVIRPKVLSIDPDSSSAGAIRGADIQIVFSEQMSDSSIYWTKEEIKKLCDNEAWWKHVPNSAAENPLYYAYCPNGSVDQIVFKNITVEHRVVEEGENTNLLKYFGMPYFSSDKTVLIIPANETNYIDAGIEVKVIITSDFCSLKTAITNSIFVSTFYTTARTDETSPSIEINSIETKEIDGNLVTIGKTNTEEWNNFSSDIPNISKEVMVSKNLTKMDCFTQVTTPVIYNGSEITIKGVVTDGDSKPSKLKLEFVPVGIPVPEEERAEYTVVAYLESNNSVSSIWNFSKNGLTYKIPYDFFKIAGAYKLVITAYDKKNNAQKFDKVFPYFVSATDIWAPDNRLNSENIDVDNIKNSFYYTPGSVNSSNYNEVRIKSTLNEFFIGYSLGSGRQDWNKVKLENADVGYGNEGFKLSDVWPNYGAEDTLQKLNKDGIKCVWWKVMDAFGRTYEAAWLQYGSIPAYGGRPDIVKINNVRCIDNVRQFDLHLRKGRSNINQIYIEDSNLLSKPKIIALNGDNYTGDQTLTTLSDSLSHINFLDNKYKEFIITIAEDTCTVKDWSVTIWCVDESGMESEKVTINPGTIPALGWSLTETKMTNGKDKDNNNISTVNVTLNITQNNYIWLDKIFIKNYFQLDETWLYHHSKYVVYINGIKTAAEVSPSKDQNVTKSFRSENGGSQFFVLTFNEPLELTKGVTIEITSMVSINPEIYTSTPTALEGQVAICDSLGRYYTSELYELTPSE